MMDLLKKKALRKESMNLLGLETEGVPNYPLAAATNLQNEVSNTILEQSTEQYPQKVSTDILIQQLTETLASYIQQQKLQMQALTQKVTELNINPITTQTLRQASFLPGTLQELDQQSTSFTQVPEHFSMATSNAPKYLSSQIPHFGDTEEEDVEIWLDKLESVAEIYNFPHSVMLAAAKLTKSAHRFDYSMGQQQLTDPTNRQSSGLQYLAVSRGEYTIVSFYKKQKHENGFITKNLFQIRL